MKEDLQCNTSYGKYLPFITILVYLILLPQVFAQTISVQGKVTSSRYRVKNALITFIDNADTTMKFSTMTDQSGNYQLGITTSIEPTTDGIPTSFKLSQSYPNPFSSSTYIPYELNKESLIKVTIYDILGRVVRKLDIGQQATGFHNVLWDGRNNFGAKVTSGVYFYRLQANGESQVKKMIFNEGGKGLVGTPRLYSSQIPKVNMSVNKDIQAGNYSIRLENTNTTLPVIISQQIDNVTIQNDTTINFSVDYLPVATLDFDSTHQLIRGFGGANVLLWRPDMTDGEINRVFGTGEGQLGFSILRLMLEADTTRWSLYLHTAKKAYDMGATVIASPWYAPNYMTEDIGNVNRVRHDMYDKYAEHLNSFSTYMANNGVPVYGISIQNEPDIEENWTSWTSDEIFTFMGDYAHAIEGTKVMAPESFHFDRTYSDPILNDSAACANTDIICGHIYGSGLSSYPLAEAKGKEIWMTEHLSGENSTPDDWSWVISAAVEMNDVLQAGMNAYIWWYIVRYYGPISDGSYLRKSEVTKKGFAMSQFARFIRPGFYRVESSIYPLLAAAKVTAYKDPASSKIVIVGINTGSESIELVLRINNIPSMTTFTPYTTSESKDCETGDDFTVTDGNISIILEPSSITTFVSN